MFFFFLERFFFDDFLACVRMFSNCLTLTLMIGYDTDDESLFSEDDDKDCVLVLVLFSSEGI